MATTRRSFSRKITNSSEDSADNLRRRASAVSMSGTASIQWKDPWWSFLRISNSVLGMGFLLAAGTLQRRIGGRKQYFAATLSVKLRWKDLRYWREGQSGFYLRNRGVCGRGSLFIRSKSPGRNRFRGLRTVNELERGTRSARADFASRPPSKPASINTIRKVAGDLTDRCLRFILEKIVEAL